MIDHKITPTLFSLKFLTANKQPKKHKNIKMQTFLLYIGFMNVDSFSDVYYIIPPRYDIEKVSRMSDIHTINLQKKMRTATAIKRIPINCGIKILWSIFFHRRFEMELKSLFGFGWWWWC